MVLRVIRLVIFLRHHTKPSYCIVLYSTVFCVTVGKRAIYVEFVVLICLKEIQVHVSRSLLSPTPRPFRHGDEARFDAKNCQLLQRQQGAVFYVVFLRCNERFSHVFLEV